MIHARTKVHCLSRIKHISALSRWSWWRAAIYAPLANMVHLDVSVPKVTLTILGVIAIVAYGLGEASIVIPHAVI